MKHFDDTLTTERLVLRRFTADDLDLLFALHSDPEVMRYTGGTLDRAGSDRFVQERVLDYYAQHPGLGMWKTLEKSSGECIGIHLLNNIRGESHIQVGYELFREYWGCGYATEMCVELLRYGFTRMGLAQIVAITDLEHVASQRVLLKSGLQRRGERAFAHPAYAPQGPLAWFESEAAQWLAAHPD